MVPKAIQAHCDLLIAFDRFFLLQVLHLILQYSLSIGANCWGNYSKFYIPVYLGQDTSPCSVNLSSLPSRHNRRCPTCTIILNYIVLEHQLCKILTKFIWSWEVALAFIAQALQCMMFDSATKQMNVNWQVGHHFVDQLPIGYSTSATN